jgi:hypothetical protein
LEREVIILCGYFDKGNGVFKSRSSHIGALVRVKEYQKLGVRRGGLNLDDPADIRSLVDLLLPLLYPIVAY